jgi:uncharacterized membrane protein YqjE
MIPPSVPGTDREEDPGVTAPSEDPQPSVGQLVSKASEHFSTLVRAEVELAKAEVSGSVKRAGVGGGLLAAAGVVLLFSVPFLFVVLAEVLVAIGLWRWLSYLIVWVLFLIIAAVLALIGRHSLKKVQKPARTIETMKDTAAWARHPTRDAG